MSQSIKIIQVTGTDGTVSEHVVVFNKDGSTVSMLKSMYDEMIAKQNELADR